MAILHLAMQQQVSDLSPQRAAVLRLHLDGYPVLEIARALTISPARVYQQLDKLRQAGLLPSKGE